jgi:hypothetical protein
LKAVRGCIAPVKTGRIFYDQNETTEMTAKIRSAAVAGIVIFVFALTLAAQTQSNPTSSPAKHSARPIPFHGMISAVDQTAKTFTISGKEKSRTFKITEKTTITKAGKSATMKDIAENQEVSGAAWQNPDGTLEAKLVKLGPAKP